MRNSKDRIEVKHLANCGCVLGEGPLWLPDKQTLMFVDIIGKQFLTWNAQTGLSRAKLSQRVGSFVATRGRSFLAASERGLFALDASSGVLSSIGHDEAIGSQNLMNDGKCDRQGRFVFGSKDLGETTATGALMSFDDGRIRSWHAATVLNGPAFSPDGSRIYFADSSARKIFTSTYDIVTGAVGDADIFATLSGDAGYPDGMTVDAEGGLWNAHWDGWRLSRYLPNGNLDLEIAMPVAKPTSLTFGGADLKTIFVTSAQKGREEDVSTPGSLEGDLFSIETGICGMVEPKFAGDFDV